MSSDPHKDYLLVREAIDNDGNKTTRIRTCSSLDEAQRQLEAVTAAKTAARRGDDKEALHRAELLERKAVAEFQRHSAPVYLDIGGDTAPPVGRRAVADGPEYRKMFPNLVRSGKNGDFRNFEEFVRAVASGRHDPRLEERAMTGAVPADGGFALDIQYEQFLLDESLGQEVFRNIPGITIYPMSSRTLQVPAFNTTDLSAGGCGGMIGYWTDENDAITETTPSFRRIELSAKKLACLTRASLELNEDSIGNFGAEVAGALARTMGRYLDAAFINGDGAGKPLGVLNSAAKVTITEEAGQVAGTIVLENISKMYARMNPAAMRRAVWLASPDVIPQLYGLTIDVGTAGSWVQPMKEESGNFYLMGRPVIFSAHCSQLGTEGDLIFFDPASYAIGIVGGSMRLDFSDHRYFESNERLWRSTIRVDGQCTVASEVTPENSGDSWSPVVTIEDR